MTDGASRKTVKKWKEHAVRVLGEDFWEEIAGVLPHQGPRTDIYVKDGKMIAVMELPGIQSPESLNVTLTGKWLSVSGDIPYDYPVLEEELLHAERHIGRFSRRIQLPEPVNPDEVHASYRHGLLILKMTVITDPNSRTVAVDFPDMSDISG